MGIHQNFFDLGGHSLLAVQLLSLVRQTFDLDLSLKVVYSGDFTVAELAKAIELREIEQAGAGRYAEILKEVESLSDEEVRALLAQEQNGTLLASPAASLSAPCASCLRRVLPTFRRAGARPAAIWPGSMRSPLTATLADCRGALTAGTAERDG